MVGLSAAGRRSSAVIMVSSSAALAGGASALAGRLPRRLLAAANSCALAITRLLASVRLRTDREIAGMAAT
jgi:hypothetical protein